MPKSKMKLWNLPHWSPKEIMSSFSAKLTPKMGGNESSLQPPATQRFCTTGKNYSWRWLPWPQAWMWGEWRIGPPKLPNEGVETPKYESPLCYAAQLSQLNNWREQTKIEISNIMRNGSPSPFYAKMGLPCHGPHPLWFLSSNNIPPMKTALSH